MDPDETWTQAVYMARRIVGGTDSDPQEDDADKLAELVLALDSWLVRGGFPPGRFRQKLIIP